MLLIDILLEEIKPVVTVKYENGCGGEASYYQFWIFQTVEIPMQVSLRMVFLLRKLERFQFLGEDFAG